MLNKKQAKFIKENCILNGKNEYHLALFGDHIAEREGYKALEGIEAVHFYICHKFRWTPSQVRGMAPADLEFLLTEEKQGWHVPKELTDV